MNLTSPCSPPGHREQRRYCRRRSGGISLLETTVSLSILLLIFVGALNLYAVTTQSAAKSQGQMFSGSDAANASQSVVETVREAYKALLPVTGESTFISPPGANIADFRVNVPQGGGGQHMVYTGVHLFFRRRVTIPVNGRSGAPLNFRAYDFEQSTSALTDDVWVYRSDKAGKADPKTGTCLWVRGGDFGETGKALITTLDKDSPESVSFSLAPDTNNLLSFSVRSSYYNPVGNKKKSTSDTTDGSDAGQLTARCVMLRTGN